jgi:hypothetical protein
MVDAEVVDTKEARFLISLNLIQITLSGEIKWRGGIDQESKEIFTLQKLASAK